MKVPFLDLKSTYIELNAELDDEYRKVMTSGWYLFGESLLAFEKNYSAYCGAQYCAGVANGLDALHVILLACGIGNGDEVIVPANTFIATWLAVSLTGAVPVPVDSTLDTYNLNPDLIQGAITPKTKAIMAVHLYGLPADMDKVNEIAASNGLKVIEDAAQAHGATYKGRRTGNLGDAAGFSFYPGKNLGAFSDAGAVVTSNSNLIERVRMIRNYGSKVKYNHETVGINSRMEELQAAFLTIKLKKLDEWNSRRKRLASIYIEKLSGACSELILPFVPTWADPVWHLFVIRHQKRDELRQMLASKGVETLIHYPVPPHLSEAYKGVEYDRKKLRNTELISSTALSLPIGPHLEESQAQYVANSLIDCLKKLK